MSSVPSSLPTAPGKSTISTDHRLRTVIIVLSVLGAFLMCYVAYITLKTKRRKMDSEQTGPYQGRVIPHSHPAADIMPFGINTDVRHKFNHKPGQNMRIAVRRGDGRWDFTDSPFGVKEIKELDDVSSKSFDALTPEKFELVKSDGVRRRLDSFLDFDVPPLPPPPAYHPNPNREQSDYPSSPSRPS